MQVIFSKINDAELSMSALSIIIFATPIKVHVVSPKRSVVYLFPVIICRACGLPPRGKDLFLVAKMSQVYFPIFLIACA